MNWVTCTLATSGRVKAFNLNLVKWIEVRASAGVSVLTFIDGTAVAVEGTVDTTVLNPTQEGVSL